MLPILVICRMMGIPEEERHEFLEIGNTVARSVDPDVGLADKLAANARIRAYIARLVELRRADPGDDLMTRLIDAADDGRALSLDELFINTGVLLIAGFETTTNLITSGAYRLLQRPDQLATFMADAELDRTAVEELLRFDPPAQFIRARTIVADTEIGGAELHPGDPVVPLLAAANRDPDEFDDARDARHRPDGEPSPVVRGRPPPLHRVRAHPPGSGDRPAPALRALPVARPGTRRGAGVPAQPAAPRLLEAPGQHRLTRRRGAVRPHK